MKKRIKELAEQAGWMMGDEVEGFNTRLERFTELIVKECADYVACGEFGDAGLAEELKKHFGVEE